MPPETTPPLRVVSVSLGAESRDHVAETEMLGRAFRLERRGVDGDFGRAEKLIGELDGHVAAIGLGGIDLYVVAGARRYTLPAAAKLARAAKVTPVVDGSGLKDTLERETVRALGRDGFIDFRGKRVLLVSGVDRFGMAEELSRTKARVTFGDLAFVVGIPAPIRSLRALRQLGALVLPLFVRLPYRMLYPTGAQQETIESDTFRARFYAQAEIIAGDFHLIRRYLPARIDGKTVLTNTVTADDVELLRQRGAAKLITTTPEFGGRSFATNVMEGVFVALGAHTTNQYRDLLKQLDWQPRVVDLQSEVKSQG